MAKKTTKQGVLTAPQQVQVLKNLKQQAAAHVLGISPRSLRDRPEIPRDDDGCFDIHDLLRHAPKEILRPDMADRDLERILVVVEILYGVVSEAEATGVYSLFGDLRARYGDAGLVVFAERLEAAIKGLHDLYPFVDSPFTEADEQRALANAVKAAREADSHSRATSLLHYTSQCDKCKRYRRGDKWVKEAPPADYIVSHGACPKCYPEEQ